jgi:hypothetical protein
MLSLAIFGGNRIDGSELEPDERVVALALFGGIELDLTARPIPDVDLLAVAVFGGVTVKVHPTQAVRLRGFSIFGGRVVEPLQIGAAGVPTARAGDDRDLPFDIDAYAVFGGVRVKREAPAVREAG